MIKLIAETAWHHDGDYDFMSNLIDSIVQKSRVDIIKLHITLDIDEYMDVEHPAYDYLKKRMFAPGQWNVFIDRIKKSGKEIMLLLNDTKAVEFAENFNPDYIEIHSVCLNDYHLLTKIKNSKLNIPIVLGIGGSDLYEIENAIDYLNWENIILMHGFQNYPTKYEDVNIAKIRKIIKLYPAFDHGYADHTAWNETFNTFISLIGASQGMKYLEKHVTIKPGKRRTDWQAAISIEQCNEISKYLHILSQCEGNGSLKLNKGEKEYAIIGLNKKAAVSNRTITSGETLQFEDISYKRVADSVDYKQIEICELIGKTAKVKIDKNKAILKEDFSE